MGKQPQAIEMMASCINSLVSSFQLSRGSIHICQMDEQMDRHITLNHIKNYFYLFFKFSFQFQSINIRCCISFRCTT